LEFGSRFTAGTGRHLISGYKRMGSFPYRSYAVITVGSMFIIQAAVTIVTAGLAEMLFQTGWSPFVWSTLILLLCILILLVGKYPGLDVSMKVIISVLTLATLFAVLMALGTDAPAASLQEPVPPLWTITSIGFIIAFMGWMPIPLDASVWHSIWTKEKAKKIPGSLSVKGAFLDFNIGYLSAAFIGVLFFLLGVLVMFGSGISFSDNSVVFSSQLIDLYGKTLGTWSKPIISIAAFITMFSTVLTVTDAYPRVLSEFVNPEATDTPANRTKWKLYRTGIWIIPVLSLSILFFLSSSFKLLVDFAAGLSFLSAPFLAWFNYKLVTGSQMPPEHRPGKAYRLFSLACFVLLVLFGGVYIGYSLW
jgi:Mn2+/Fe2+ NRAMP family transporter